MVELTPPGQAAVAVVLVAGPEALQAIGDCFVPFSGRSLVDVPLGRIVLGRWDSAEGEELIVCRPSEDQVEIHCHGGTAAVGAIIDRLVERGCRQVAWQDWLRVTTCGDATTRAARIALAEAATGRTAAVLLDQYQGALSGAIRSAIDAVAVVDWARAADILDDVLRFREVGLHLTKPWRIVLAGAPNVGKSSLINTLAGYERAIVSPQPGTTRDVVTTTTAIAGWPVQLADTAGLRESGDALESAGAALAADAVADADLVIVVRDDRRDSDFARIVAALPPEVRVIHVRNKIDLLDAYSRRDLDTEAELATSAITGEGVGDLMAAIARTLVPVNPDAGAAVPFTIEQVAGLEDARSAISGHDACIAAKALNALLLNGKKD